MSDPRPPGEVLGYYALGGEREPDLLGASPHLLAVGRVPEGVGV